MSEAYQAGSREVAMQGRVRGSATETGAWLQAAIDRSPAQSFAVLSLVYVCVVLVMSSFKLLWLDELITLHIARQGSIPAIWAALQRGADPNPPVTHILVYLSSRIFGAHEFAYRLPDLVGYWVGMLALFSYLRRYVSATWALGGVMTSMAMAAFDYSYESRSYAIFYGFAMAAFTCWVYYADEQSPRKVRAATLAGMTVALAAGISTNYFAVLAFFPVAAGELTRTVLRLRLGRKSRAGLLDESRRASILRSLDLPVWIAMILAASPLLAYRGMIAHSIAQFSPYAWNKVSLDQVFDSYTEMVEVILYPILTLFVAALLSVALAGRLSRLCGACRADLRTNWLGRLLLGKERLGVPVREAVGVFFLMAYPILGYVIASIRGGMLSPRFVIPVCFGFAIAATLVSRFLFSGFSQAGLVFLAFTTAWFAAREAYVGYSYEEQKQCFYKVVGQLTEADAYVPADSPIVIPDPLLALTFEHYAPTELARRVVFPVDFPAIRHFRRDDSPEENLWAGRNFLYTLPIMPLATFQHAAGKYLMIASEGNWLLNDLAAHHYPVKALPLDTRADAIGGFTPLARGKPAYFSTCGDQPRCSVTNARVDPVPFNAADNLPDAKFNNPDDAER